MKMQCTRFKFGMGSLQWAWLSACVCEKWVSFAPAAHCWRCCVPWLAARHTPYPSHLSTALTVTLTVNFKLSSLKNTLPIMSHVSVKVKKLYLFYSHGSFLLSVEMSWTSVASVSPCLVFCTTWFSCVQGIHTSASSPTKIVCMGSPHRFE